MARFSVTSRVIRLDDFFRYLKQRVNKWRSSGATERNEDAQQQNGNHNRDQIPLFVMPEEQHELSKEPGILLKFVG